MSALIYCDNKDASNFEEMCPLAQFITVVYASCIPFCAVGSVLCMATVFLVKKLHTPHDYILFAIAVSDFLVGVFFSPYQVMNLLPEARSLIASQRWSCTLFLHLAWFSSSAQLDMLVIMCINSLFMVNRPVWYLNHITKRKTIGFFVTVQVVRILVHIFGVIYQLLGPALDTPWTPDRCSAEYVNDIIPATLVKIFLWLLFIEILVCIAFCIQVATVSLLYRRKMSDTDWKAAMLLFALTCSCIVMWIPTLAYIGAMFFVPDIGDELNIMNDQGRLWRLLYSTLNAPICAATRPRYRMAFRFLLTTPPWRWRRLSRYLNRHAPSMGGTTVDTKTRNYNSQGVTSPHASPYVSAVHLDRCGRNGSVYDGTAKINEYCCASPDRPTRIKSSVAFAAIQSSAEFAGNRKLSFGRKLSLGNNSTPTDSPKASPAMTPSVSNSVVSNLGSEIDSRQIVSRRRVSEFFSSEFFEHLHDSLYDNS